MRHRQRHLHKTLCEHVRGLLDAGGWFGPNVPFGAAPAVLQEMAPDDLTTMPAPDTVAVSMGTEAGVDDEEIGGGLLSCRTEFYVDVFGQDLSTAVALSSDVRDGLSRATVPLLDFSTNPAGDPTGGLIEFDEVAIDIPPVASQLDKRCWRVVTGGATVFFGE